MKKNDKPVLKRRTKFTILAIFNIIWYTVVVLVLSFFDHVVPEELTTAWFAAWTIELALLFGIKVKSKDTPSSEYKDMPDYTDEIQHEKEQTVLVPEIEQPTLSLHTEDVQVQDESEIPDYDEDLG